MVTKSGFRVYKDGNIISDTTDPFGNFIGTFNTGTETGSITDVKTIGRRLFTYCIWEDYYGAPVITHNPSTGQISWQYLATGTTARPAIPNETIEYGTF